VSYRHTQFGRPPAILLAISLLVVLAILLAIDTPPILLWPVLILDLALILVFTRMTTIVTDRVFAHHFGLGFWRKSYPLQDIVGVSAVRNSWWYGFGIRLTPHGWLYNVWGLDAIEVTLAGGRTFRVGTDDQRDLIAALGRGGVDIQGSRP